MRVFFLKKLNFCRLYTRIFTYSKIALLFSSYCFSALTVFQLLLFFSSATMQARPDDLKMEVFVVKYGNKLKRQEDIPPPAYTPRELPPAYTPPIELKDGKITEFPVISKLVHYDEKLCLSCFVGDFQLLMNYIIESNGQVMFHVGFIDNVHTKVRVYKGLPSTKINFNLSIEFDIACFLHEYVGKQYDEQHNMFELMKEFYRTAYKISKNKALIRPMNDFFSRPYGFRY